MWDCPRILRSSDYWIRVHVETTAPERRTGASAKAAAEPDGTGVQGARCCGHRERRDNHMAGESVSFAAGPRNAPGPLSRRAPGGLFPRATQSCEQDQEGGGPVKFTKGTKCPAEESEPGAW